MTSPAANRAFFPLSSRPASLYDFGMSTSRSCRRFAWLMCSCAIACVPPVAPRAQQGEQKPESGTNGVPDTLTAPAPATPGHSSPSEPALAPRSSTESLTCVSPPDPELDAESPWSKELGQLLHAELPKLARCTAGLSSADEAEVTVRLVYAQDGSPTSQYVVRSTTNACEVTECLKEELAKVHSPKLVIDRASYDLALVLARGATPERASEPPDALTEGPSDDPSSCVDPEVLRLSRAAVRGVVSTRYEELTACYTQALTRDHQAAGNVTFELVIGHEGQVADLQVREATLHDCPAIHCMLDQLRTLAFPAPVGRSVRVIYPIRYEVEQPSVSLR